MPVVLASRSCPGYCPVEAKVPALTLITASRGAVGFVKPETVNKIAALALKVPDNIVIVKRKQGMLWSNESPHQPNCSSLDALPVAPDGALNVTTGAGQFTRANPAPTSVMIRLPPVGIAVVGVNATVMVTPAAAATVLLRVTVG